MAMIATRQHRSREIPGPAPQSFAIIERGPRKGGAEQQLKEMRQQNALKEVLDQEADRTRRIQLRNDWEARSYNQVQNAAIDRKVREMKRVYEYSLAERKERLKELLMREEQMYLAEMAASQETVLERQAKMRERARQLKEDREQERLQYVQERLDEQWRDQCHELRATMARRQLDLVAVERMEQMRIKDDIEKTKQEEEKMYAELWYADMMAKAKREEEDALKKQNANRGIAEVLHQQMAALEAKKQEEKRLIAEEAQLMKEQAALRKIEELRALEDKRQRQAETRRLYDKSLQLKRQKEAREMQEQLAFDMKILEQLLEETQNEAMQTAQRKRELQEENKRYRDYLKQLREEEVQREIELERLVEAEIEKNWEKRIRQWRLEKEARRKLMEEVMESRRKQLAAKLFENERLQHEAMRESEELARRIEENRRIEQQELEANHKKKLRYQADLLGQIDYNRRQNNLVDDEERRIWEAQNLAEQEYRTKLEIALANPMDRHAHPIRRRFTENHLMGQGQNQSRGGRMN